LGNRQQPLGLITIAHVNSEYIPDGEIMTGSRDYPNLVASAHTPLDDDSLIGARSHRLGKAARKDRIVHPNSKPPAGDPWLGDLNDRGPDLPTLSDKRLVHVYAFRR
jgi:hypothetical protein